ncbi:Uncharacterised protein [Vibrio cholerae]|nr:Uncharacterised protein [Vibrio cholerae]
MPAPVSITTCRYGKLITHSFSRLLFKLNTEALSTLEYGD